MDYVPTDNDYRREKFGRLPTAEYRNALDRIYSYSPHAWSTWVSNVDPLYQPFAPAVLKDLLIAVEVYASISNASSE